MTWKKTFTITHLKTGDKNMILSLNLSQTLDNKVISKGEVPIKKTLIKEIKTAMRDIG